MTVEIVNLSYDLLQPPRLKRGDVAEVAFTLPMREILRHWHLGPKLVVGVRDAHVTQAFCGTGCLRSLAHSLDIYIYIYLSLSLSHPFSPYENVRSYACTDGSVTAYLFTCKYIHVYTYIHVYVCIHSYTCSICISTCIVIYIYVYLCMSTGSGPAVFGAVGGLRFGQCWKFDLFGNSPRYPMGLQLEEPLHDLQGVIPSCISNNYRRLGLLRRLPASALTVYSVYRYIARIFLCLPGCRLWGPCLTTLHLLPVARFRRCASSPGD